MGRWTGRGATGRRKSRSATRAIDAIPERRRSRPRREVRLPQRTASRGWRGAGSATTRSASTACPSCSSRRSSISIPTTRTRRCAPSRGSGSARLPCRWAREPRRRRGRWTTSASDPTRPTTSDGVARPAGERQSPLPFGFAFENPRSLRAAVGGRRRPLSTARLLTRSASSRTRACSSRSCATTDTRGELGADRPGFGTPGALDRVFLSCAACHVGRVVVAREDEVPARHAEHGDRSAVLLEADDAHRGGAGGVGLRPRVDRSR